MDIEHLLWEMGLSKNEIKIYLILLKLGLTTTGAIIKQTGIHNSKVYDGLERLAQKGLVTHVIEAGTKHFKAVNPERLLDFLDDKQKSIEDHKRSIHEFLPQLKAMQEMGVDETEAEVFQGWKGMETIFQEGVKVMGKG